MKIKNYMVFVALIIGGVSFNLDQVKAQSLSWAKTFPTANGYSHKPLPVVKVDAQKNVYTMGVYGTTIPFQSNTVDFDPGPGTFNMSTKFENATDTLNEGNQTFVTKLDANGDLVWAKQLAVRGTNMTIDGSGYIYLTGYFLGTVDFNPGTDDFFLTAPLDGAMFVCKLDKNGDFVWAEQFNGLNGSFAWSWALAADKDGNVYVTGSFLGSMDFNPDNAIADTFILSAAIGLSDGFICKLNSGGKFVWAVKQTSITDSVVSAVKPSEIDLDATGAIYVSGIYIGKVDFNPDSFETSILSAGDAFSNVGGGVFVSKLSNSGGFKWVSSVEGAVLDNIYVFSETTPSDLGMTLDAYGNVYTSSYFTYKEDFDPGIDTFYMETNKATNCFVSKLNTNGDLVWAKQMIGDTSYLNRSTYSYSSGVAMATDKYNNVYITGIFGGRVDFDPGPDSAYYISSVAISREGFICSLDPAGNFRGLSQMKGDKDFKPSSIAIDSSGYMYTTGYFTYSADFDPEPSEYTIYTKYPNYQDLFVEKLGPSCQILNLSVTKNGQSLKANASNATYQWIDCDKGGTPIPGATNQSFTSSVNGNYAVIISHDFCSDTSACQSITTGIEQVGNPNSLEIYPNPNNGHFNLIAEHALRNASVKISNIVGTIIVEQKELSGTQFSFDMGNYTPGIYFIDINENDIVFRYRIVKQ